MFGYDTPIEPTTTEDQKDQKDQKDSYDPPEVFVVTWQPDLYSQEYFVAAFKDFRVRQKCSAKAESIGYHPEIILAGRRLNDSMGAYVVTQLVKAMTRRRLQVDGARVLIMGLTFKENCPDVRNTRVIDIYHELRTFDMAVDVYDPWASAAEVQEEYGIKIHTGKAVPDISTYAAVVLAV